MITPAAWGLAALRDKRMLGLLRDLLRYESAREGVDEEVLWQLMVGLDSLGEDILRPLQEDRFERAGDRWAAARLYLGRHG